jgi:hypothetical protein
MTCSIRRRKEAFPTFRKETFLVWKKGQFEDIVTEGMHDFLTAQISPVILCHPHNLSILKWGEGGVVRILAAKLPVACGGG